MRSTLAIRSRERLLAQSRQLTPELRLEAFLAHSRLMTELYRSALDQRKRGVAPGP